MKLVAIVTIACISLAGCSDEPDANVKLQTAIARAMCAPTMDDLKLALGDVAVASDEIDLKTRKGRVAELADQVTSADCPGKPSIQRGSSLPGPAADDTLPDR